MNGKINEAFNKISNDQFSILQNKLFPSNANEKTEILSDEMDKNHIKQRMVDAITDPHSKMAEAVRAELNNHRELLVYLDKLKVIREAKAIIEKPNPVVHKHYAISNKIDRLEAHLKQNDRCLAKNPDKGFMAFLRDLGPAAKKIFRRALGEKIAKNSLFELKGTHEFKEEVHKLKAGRPRQSK